MSLAGACRPIFAHRLNQPRQGFRAIRENSSRGIQTRSPHRSLKHPPASSTIATNGAWSHGPPPPWSESSSCPAATARAGWSASVMALPALRAISATRQRHPSDSSTGGSTASRDPDYDRPRSLSACGPPAVTEPRTARHSKGDLERDEGPHCFRPATKASARVRRRSPTTIPSGAKLTEATFAPGMANIRLNAVVTRTWSAPSRSRWLGRSETYGTDVRVTQSAA